MGLGIFSFRLLLACHTVLRCYYSLGVVHIIKIAKYSHQVADQPSVHCDSHTNNYLCTRILFSQRWMCVYLVTLIYPPILCSCDFDLITFMHELHVDILQMYPCTTRSSANAEEPCEHTVSLNRVKCCTNLQRIAFEQACNWWMTFKVTAIW